MKRILFLLFALAVSPLAASQDFPNRPVKLVVPYAAGGLPDTMMRIVQLRAAEFLGQQVVIENRGGAGGIAGSEAVAKSAPDGYTLLVADVGQVAINPLIFSKLPYDPQKDLTPVTLIGTSRLFLCLHPSVPAKNFEEFIAYVRANPGKVNYGSSGIGSIHHLATEALMAALRLNMAHVPYKGMGQAVPALVAGEVNVLYSALPAIEGYIRGGKLKMVAVSTKERSAEAPDVPTVAELGVPGYHFTPEIGLLAPAGTPRAVREKISRELARQLALPEVRERLQNMGFNVATTTPEEHEKNMRVDMGVFSRLVVEAGLKAK